MPTPRPTTATTPRPEATNGHAPPVELPRSFQELRDQIPYDYMGARRMRWIADRLPELPREDHQFVSATFERWVRRMVERDASDLDLGGPAALEKLWYRVDGLKKPDPTVGKLAMEDADIFLLAVISPWQRDHLIERFAVDFGYSLQNEHEDRPRRFRTTIYFDNQHLALSIRMLAWKPRALRSLGFHPLIERGLLFRHVRDGLTLVTGVTGSGKSTTLDAIVDANNDDVEAGVLIVAQPLEYIHESRKCIIRHREVGVDVANFVDGMVQGLRQDPDIVVVGEMRDAETITTAMETSDTGHKVFSTLHTGSAIETIDRVVAEYPSVEQDRVRHRLADVLRCVISQKLLPSVSGGRVLAKEVLWMTPSTRAAIKNDHTGEIYQMIWQGADQGMITLEQDLARLARLGDITTETAVNYANNKRRLLQLLR